MDFIDLNDLIDESVSGRSTAGLFAFLGLMLAALDNFNLAIISFSLAFTLFAAADQDGKMAE